MIEVQKTVPDSLHHTCVVATWPNMTNGDEGSAIELANFADRSVQVTGDNGAGSAGDPMTGLVEGTLTLLDVS